MNSSIPGYLYWSLLLIAHLGPDLAGFWGLVLPDHPINYTFKKKTNIFKCNTGSTRCAALSLLMAIIVLYGTYTAAITSELSDIQVQMPFLNLFQMYTETETKVGTVKGTVITEIFKV